MTIKLSSTSIERCCCVVVIVGARGCLCGATATCFGCCGNLIDYGIRFIVYGTILAVSCILSVIETPSSHTIKSLSSLTFRSPFSPHSLPSSHTRP